MRDFFIGTIVLGVMMFVVLGALSIGEQNECRGWKKEKPPLTEWQIDQCAHYQINLQD